MRSVVGVDVGGTKIQVAVMRGRAVIGRARAQTPGGEAGAVVQALVSTVGAAVGEAGLSQGEVGAVGIGFPGQFDRASGDTLYATNMPGFHHRFPLSREVSAALGGLPIAIDNDVRAALIGEYRLGSGRGYKNVLGVFAGTGLGGGLVLEGRLRHGRGAAGEIGHTVVKDGGRECGCGRRGCLEAYAGRGRMEVRARELVKSGKRTVLFDIQRRKGRDRMTSGVIYAALQQGDRVAKSLVDEAVWALGISLGSIQNVLDLEAIILGGGLGDRLGEPFRARVLEAVKKHLLVGQTPPALLGTELGDLSGAVGAGLLAQDLLRRGTDPSSRRPGPVGEGLSAGGGLGRDRKADPG
ncbi:MAG: ROK family protein [Candidatus Dormibacteria bacterium]